MSNQPRNEISIDNRLIGSNHPCYFIADIAANHDGNLERAKELIWLAKSAGADVAKFQHFQADTIVSDVGFRSMGSQQGHQANWKKSVYEVYKDASLELDWTSVLKQTCEEAGITFFSTPYSPALVDSVDSFVSAYKIGSGDISWPEMIKHVASKGKPYILATGASSMDEVDYAVQTGLEINNQLALLQCNTNYTGSLDNFRYIQLNVLKCYRSMYPNMILGLSDHTPGHSCVLGAVALGARIIEKHFTDDCGREGPDHQFSMDPKSWREMVDRTRELELALGNGIKRVENNEKETVIVQRRSLHFATDLPANHILHESDFIALRPCREDSFSPKQLSQVLGRKLRCSKSKGEHLSIFDIN